MKLSVLIKIMMMKNNAVTMNKNKYAKPNGRGRSFDITINIITSFTSPVNDQLSFVCCC